jgi:hypothetical protein
MKWLLLIPFVLLAYPGLALAGPPYQLDDPDVIPFRHFEFYVFGTASSAPGEVDTGVPGLELNWSGVPNVMFHFVVSTATAKPSDGPTTVGVGDTEAGLQYRFVEESDHRPMIGTFTMLELPTGNADRGLGAGGFSIKLPIWMQKSVAGWTINWGGGEVLTRVADSSNHPFGGALVQHDVGKRLTLGTELFYHGADAPDARNATMIDLGGNWSPFQNPDHQVLFAYGRSIEGQSETYGYLALYWTWGP